MRLVEVRYGVTFGKCDSSDWIDYEVDQDELNDLIAERDVHALAFFGLEDSDDEDLDEWDTYDLEEVPTIAEFQKDFEPYSPYDAGWTLHVEFVDPNE